MLATVPASYGKSDPIDALAVAHAPYASPTCPPSASTAPPLPGCSPATVMISSPNAPRDQPAAVAPAQTRPLLQSQARSLWRPKNSPDHRKLTNLDGLVVRLAGTLTQRGHGLTTQIHALDQELNRWSPSSLLHLMAICGCATLTATKIIGQTADVTRFRSRHAYARHNGTAPVPVWSSNRHRHRLSRIGNRQLNTALHCIAITQGNSYPDARQLLQRGRAAGDTKTESIHALKRRLSNTVYRALLADATKLSPSLLDRGVSGRNRAAVPVKRVCNANVPLTFFCDIPAI